jgi:hypothetical protein
VKNGRKKTDVIPAIRYKSFINIAKNKLPKNSTKKAAFISSTCRNPQSPAPIRKIATQ